MFYFENLLSEYQALLCEDKNFCKTITALKNTRTLQTVRKGIKEKQKF